MPQSAIADRSVFVLFGATGDLARRMVLPAFYQLAQHGLLPERWQLVGTSRSDLTSEDFRERVHAALKEFGPERDDGWEDFAERLRFAGGGFSEDDPGRLLDVLSEADGELGGQAQLVHYLALPPNSFGPITRALRRHGLADRSRVVYEKPFGTSPEDFRALDATVSEVLHEKQVFRIDHFLGKEATQDLHSLRFGNGLFSHAWHRSHLRAVQIDVPETLDIVDRASFYDETGALLDMVVTHLFQLAAEVAMEPRASMSAGDLQQARESVIAAFRPLAPEDVVLGQFEGYQDTDGVRDDSQTDTFVAARLWVDTDRWRDVPFLLRTGKQLARSAQQVSLVFRAPEDGPLRDALPALGNVLTLSLSGSGSIALQMVVQEPGVSDTLTTAQAQLQLAQVEGGEPLPPYVRLIHDVLVGDRSLFTRPDGLAPAWAAVEPVLRDRPQVQPYAKGSWGPQAAEELAGPDGWVLHGDEDA